MRLNIEQVMVLLIAGEKIRKPTWRKKTFIHLVDGELLFNNGKPASIDGKAEYERVKT